MVRGERVVPSCAPVEEPMIKREESKCALPVREKVVPGVVVPIPTRELTLSMARKFAESRVVAPL